jgi:alpha-N-acetylglucosaminidase
MTDAEISAFLAGPPYLPFGWMGCLDGYGGPLPKNWISRRIDLEKKILARERELGMTPVLQGFTGHVPETLVKEYPGAKVHTIDWTEFHTFMLDPQDPLFQKLGTAFIEEQTRLFGTDHRYAADSFIEMTPPSGDLKYLARVGRAIYESMARADAQAVWLLQGWTFMNQGQFWSQDRIKAFLDAVPNDRLLVLDLFCDNHPVWNQTQGFYGKRWVWSFVYNFGDRTILGSSGPLGRFNDLADARKDPMGHNLQGVGLMMEGYGHNPLVLDLMFELAWRGDVELRSWVREFSRFRYGKENADAESAWEILRTALYDHGADGQTIVTAFPSVGQNYTRYPAGELASTCRLLLRAAPELGTTETYRHDLANVARQALSNHGGDLYAKAMAAYQARDAAAFRQASAEFLQLIRDLDELLSTDDQFLLGNWLRDAKRWGATDKERAKLEWNARRILTRWALGTVLRDYAWKEWSGLLTGFYGRRWEIFFQRQQESLDVGKPFDQDRCLDQLRRFEDDWAKSAEDYPTKPKGDSIAIAQRLFEKYMSGVLAPKAVTSGKAR